MFKKLLDNPEKKFELLSKLVLYIAVITSIINLLNYILTGIQSNNGWLYILYGLVNSISIFIVLWIVALILQWFKDNYRRNVE